MFTDKSLFQNNKELKNRKRGKGKIKIIKRQHVNNAELIKELQAFKATVEVEKEQKKEELKKIKEEIVSLKNELEEYQQLKRPRENTLTDLKNKLKDKKAEYDNVFKRPCNGRATERLGEMFLDLIENYATKPCYSGYTYLEEMKSRATFFLLKYSRSFNPEKSNNAFAYCTEIVKNAFIQVIKKEKKKSEAKKQYVEDYLKNLDYHKKDDRLLG
jgi:hypothetical protein